VSWRVTCRSYSASISLFLITFYASRRTFRKVWNCLKGNILEYPQIHQNFSIGFVLALVTVSIYRRVTIIDTIRCKCDAVTAVLMSFCCNGAPRDEGYVLCLAGGCSTCLHKSYCPPGFHIHNIQTKSDCGWHHQKKMEDSSRIACELLYEL